MYFYLVNLYGDVPLPLTTDYTKNENLFRSPKDVVYDKIIADLKSAEDLLSADYLDGTLLNITMERVRPCKAAASAMLARTYLFKEDFKNAEIYSSKVIDNSTYNLSTLEEVFKKNSAETIWALQPVVNGQNTKEAIFYGLNASGPNQAGQPVYLSNDFITSIEPTDQRKQNWIGVITSGTNTYPYPLKYKAKTFPITTPPTSAIEYSIVLRLAELYLIRAEARAQMENLQGAQDDINKIRSRAGLENTTADTKEDLLAGVLKESRVEFFSEWGHRWFDLKRMKKVNDIMSSITPTKEGGIWKPDYQYYPIPQSERTNNPNLTQNAGYQN